MKKSILSVVVVAAISVMAGCGSDDDPAPTSNSDTSNNTDSGNDNSNTDGGGNNDNSSPTVEALPLNINQDTTLDASVIYNMTGEVVVESGATLTIPAGTKIFASSPNAYLAISQGATLNAVGTKENPILMTSEADYQADFKQSVDGQEAQGQWGGLSVFGYAQTNEGSVQTYEAGDHEYGCDNAEVTCNDADSSGNMQYIVLKHTGFEVEVDAELNGLSLAGVGSGTTVENIAVLAGSDDGIEVWGGTVEMTNIYMYNAFDDSLDWDEGWTGSATNVYIEQNSHDGDSGRRGMETDNNGGLEDENNTPRSNPDITNFTIRTISPGGAGIVNREGTAGNLSNGLIVVADESRPCVEVRSSNTVNSGLSYTDIACVQSADIDYKGKEANPADNIHGTVTDAQAAALVSGNSITRQSEDADTANYGVDMTVFDWVSQYRN